MSRLLQDYARDRAEHDGGAVALVLDDERLTYSELERRSNRLARQLVEAGCERGQRVCLFVDKSPGAVVAMLATLKAGCAYVPIDVAGPAPRAARFAVAADPTLVLVAGGGAEAWERVGAVPAPWGEVRVGALDVAAAERLAGTVAFGPGDVAAQSADPPPRTGAGRDVAHILFTSGSTGAPKGVMITHENVTAFVDWAVGHFGIAPGDRISGHPPLHFDLSTFDVYGALCAGAELHLVPSGLVMARQLAEFISVHELTQWFCVPSAMTYMARFAGLPAEGFPSLRRILWCGEVLPTPVLIEWMQRVPQASFTNLYGPTETTIASSYHAVDRVPDDPACPIPIGRACGGEELFVLSGDGRQAAVDELGEIHIAGAGVSPGYWRDEHATRTSFVSAPRSLGSPVRAYRTGDLGCVDAGGVLHFAGRRDAQIKSRGYRIELGEIEAAIAALDEVAQCAVVAVESEDFAGTAICCAFTPVDRDAGQLVALRSALREVLPTYMLPSRWRRMDALPINANGKLDRQALTLLFTQPVAAGTHA